MNIYAYEENAPQDKSGRAECELRTYEMLDKLNIKYVRIDHDAAFSISDCEEAEKKLGISICKNLFLCNSQKSRFYLVMMPGNKKFSTKDFSHKMGIARVSFAPEEYMKKYLDILPGSVSVLGLMNDKNNNVTLVMDKCVFDGEYIGCHPCMNTSSLKIKTEDILKKFLPATAHEVKVLEL